MYSRVSIAACFLLMSMGSGVCSENEGQPFSYDVRVVGTTDLSVAPHFEMLFEITRLGSDHRIWPVLSVSGLDSCLEKRFNRRIGNVRTTWKDVFDLDCRGMSSRQRSERAGWRVRLVDGEGLPVAVPLSEVRFELPRPEASVNRSAQWQLAGFFEADRFSIEVPGFKTGTIAWRQDLSPNRPAVNELVVEVESLDQAATSEARAAEIVAASDELIARNERPMSDELEPPASDELSAAQDEPPPAELRSLTFRLEGHHLPERWPRGAVWLRALDEESWRAAPLDHQYPTGRDWSLELPEDLNGRDVLVQVTTLGGEGLITLPIDQRSADGLGRVKIPGIGAAAYRLNLWWPTRPWREVGVEVLDPRGGPIAGATVAIQSVAQRRVLESTSELSAANGWTRHALMPSDARQFRVLCTKAGWASQLMILGRESLPARLECRLAPLEQARRREPVAEAALFHAQVVDAAEAHPAVQAEVLVRWPGHAEALRAVDFGAGLFALPTPIPVPPEAEIRVEAPCYRTFSETSTLPLEAPIQLDYHCRRAGISLRLIQDGSRAPIARAREARAVVRQAGEVRVAGIGFDQAGYSEVKEFLFDPEGGPVHVDVEATGFATTSIEIDDLLKRLGDGTIAGDYEISLRPEGRGLAVLLNAAERWPFYPRARDAVIDALRVAFPGEPAPDLLAFGLLSGSTRRLAAASLADENALSRQLAWLQGLSATGGQLTPALLEARLQGFRDLWPSVSSWQVVLVVPFNTLVASDRLSKDEMRRLLDELGAQGVTLYVIEDGGRHPVYAELAEKSGGKHVNLSENDPLARAETVKTHLASFFAAVGKGEADAE